MNIGIVGFGRFGKLIAIVLQRNHNVTIYDKKDKKEEAEIANVKLDTLEKTCQQDFIILSVPISEIENVLKEIKDKIQHNTVVMDVCSVKEYPSELMLKYLPKSIYIVASHPMFGPDSAKDGLKGLQMIFCPLRITKERMLQIETIFKMEGLVTMEVTPEEHDRQSAFSLCLVHFLGRGLENMKVTPQEITTLGFERLLKIHKSVTNDSLKLFKDMQRHNRFAKALREDLIESLISTNETLCND